MRGSMTALELMFVALLSTEAAAAKPRVEATPVPAQMRRLLACQGIAEAGARLACFDRESESTGAALTRSDLVVIDRESVHKTRRSLFGLTIPDLGLFGGDGEDAIKQIEGTIAGVSTNRDGGLVFTLVEGSRWSQTDDRPWAVDPRSGEKVIVKRASLGSYTLTVRGQPGVRVRRIN